MALLDLLAGSTDLQSSETRTNFYVQLRSGRVEVTEPADWVRLDVGTLSLLRGDTVVACYERSDVLYCSRELVSQPMV